MASGGILIFTVILIALLVLFKRISVEIRLKDKLSIIIDTGILSLTLSNFEKKKRVRNVSTLIQGIRFLVRGSDVRIDRLILSNLSRLSEEPNKKMLFYLIPSSVIPLLTKEAKSTSFSDSAYLVDVYEGNTPDISVKFDFSVIRLCISLLIVAYYKIKYAIKRGYRHAG